MEGTLPEKWAGVRWVGEVELGSLAEHSHLRLLNSEGYERARLLVRDGAAVRGFVDLDAAGGTLDRRALDAAVASLPQVPPAPPAASSPSITVVVCTRDRAPLLRGALQAILGLDYPCFDIVVVDNASRTTATQDLVHNEFADPRVSLVLEPTPGLSNARNTGLRHARGDIVAFTDDDVIVDRAWLREISAGFEKDPAAVCVTGLVPAGEVRSRAQHYFDGRVSWSKSVVPQVYSLAKPPAGMPTFPFCIGAYGTGANFAIDRRAALRLGGFDPALGVGTRTGGGEDIDMFTRVVLAGHSLVVQPSAIVWHRHRDDMEALRVQARGYGNGLGAWLAKIMLNPRTARLALARSPRAVHNLLANARVPKGDDGSSAPVLAKDPEIGKVLKLELLSVFRGPFNYLLQRRVAKNAA
jgi:GT2 family glycosyltransferase